MASPTERESIQRYDKHVNPAFVRLLGTLGYGRVFVRAKGSRVWDEEGREYLDMLAGFGATSLGHNPPELIAKMKSFLDDDAVNLVHTGPQTHAADLACDLAALAGGDLEVSMFGCSGGEALEAAMKLARAATKRTRIVYAKGGFHGTGLGPLSVMGSGRMRDPFEPLLPDCVEVPWNDAKAIDAALAEAKCAAVVLEPIQIEAGVLLPKEGYLAEVHALCKRRGALFVLDEIQTGLGRTGSLFAYEREGFVPDVLVLGKALGGGMVPISAALASRDVWTRAYGSADKFDLHGTTYSGNAFACRTAREVLRLTQEMELSKRADELGKILVDHLRERVAKHPLVRDVRGRGLIVALELGAEERGGIGKLLSGVVDALSKKVFGQWLAVRLLEKNIICQPASQQWNVLRLEPPLTVTEAEVIRTAEEIGNILSEYEDLLPLIRDVGERLGKQALGGFRFG
jgi:putrescine aminotransferase